MKFVILPISWVFKPYFYLFMKHPEFKAMYLLMQIEKLELEKKTNEARALRKNGLDDWLVPNGKFLLQKRKKCLKYMIFGE